MVRRSRSRAALAIVLLAAAAVFAVGVGSRDHNPAITKARRPPSRRSGAAVESGTEGGAGEAGTTAERHPVESAGHEAGGEQVFGINTESTALVMLVLTVSAGLAAAVWLTWARWLLVSVAVFAVSAAAFDAREAVHQADESHTLLIPLAFVVATLHASAALIAVRSAQDAATAAT
jgi:hypothetical protein